MQGKNHVALALAAPLAAALIGRPDLVPTEALDWGALIIGSLAPDIDGGGHIARWGNFLPSGITPKPLVSLLNGIGKTVSDVIRSIFGHRKTFHWPLWGGLIMAAGIYTGREWLIWLGVGYLLHIAGDSLTKSGVPLFGPLLKWDVSFTPMVTGKGVESAFGWLLWAFVAWQSGAYLIDLARGWVL
ncbi:MAG: metal-dependent hydrolase [Chloroflexota bacterium]